MQPAPSPASFPQQATQQATQHGAQQQPSAHSPVDVVRERLAGIENLTTLEQVDAFDAVHRLLQDSLAAVEQELRTDAPQQQSGQGDHNQRPGGHSNHQNRHGKNRHGRR